MVADHAVVGDHFIGAPEVELVPGGSMTKAEGPSPRRSRAAWWAALKQQLARVPAKRWKIGDARARR